MNLSVLIIRWAFLTALREALANNMKRMCHIIVNDSIFMDCMVCDDFLSVRSLALGSGSNLEKPSSDMQTEMYNSSSTFQGEANYNSTCIKALRN